MSKYKNYLKTIACHIANEFYNEKITLSDLYECKFPKGDCDFGWYIPFKYEYTLLIVFKENYIECWYNGDLQDHIKLNY